MCWQLISHSICLAWMWTSACNGETCFLVDTTNRDEITYSNFSNLQPSFLIAVHSSLIPRSPISLHPRSRFLNDWLVFRARASSSQQQYVKSLSHNLHKSQRHLLNTGKNTHKEYNQIGIIKTTYPKVSVSQSVSFNATESFFTPASFSRLYFRSNFFRIRFVLTIEIKSSPHCSVRSFLPRLWVIQTLLRYHS